MYVKGAALSPCADGFPRRPERGVSACSQQAIIRRALPGIAARDELDLSTSRNWVTWLSIKVVILLRADGRMAIDHVDEDVLDALLGCGANPDGLRMLLALEDEDCEK